MRKIFTIILFSACFVNFTNAQNYLSLGDEAMNNGKYQEAIDYYSKAFEQNSSDDITKKINFAQNLKKEFDEIDAAIESGNISRAETHVNNVLMIDPSNKFIEAKRQEIKQKQKQLEQKKRQRRWDNVIDGFKGDYDYHDMLGGFHFRGGVSLIDMRKINNTFNQGYAVDLYYNNSRHFPLTFDFGAILGANNYQAFNLGINSSYVFTKRFTFDYGLGYQWNTLSFNEEDVSVSNPYYRLGCTLMFDGKKWGGLNYSYIHNFNTPYPISTHNITYIVGREPTALVASLGLLLGLISLGSLSN